MLGGELLEIGKLGSRRSESRSREDIEDTLAGVRCGDPDQRQVGVKAAVEVEDETVRRK